jgi:CheY-like chemotaxis protein
MALKLEKLSVLVVEDTAPMRKLIVSVLESLGVGTVYTASDGREGFEQFQRLNPDIIITDWLMQPVDGIEFIRTVRTHMSSPNRTVPIIIITGYSAITRVIQARDHGVTEFLVKPFTANDLAKRIAYVVNKPRDFVHAPRYFGPDRRRRRDENYAGADRRRLLIGKKETGVPDIDFGDSTWEITT